MGSQGFVDYDRVATRYEEGRALPPEVAERWRRVTQRYLPARCDLVVDLGAGTGVFARLWPSWTDARVVAVEPSVSMIHAGRVEDPRVAFVGAVAEALPLRAHSVDVVWMSTSLHHFGDVRASLAEVRRVARPGGRVLVRTYAPGRTTVTWLEQFPGRAKWEGRFHTGDQLEKLFALHGFEPVADCDVLEASEPYEASARWVARMRHADSILTALTDEDVAEGLRALRSQPKTEGRLEMTLFVFEAS